MQRNIKSGVIKDVKKGFIKEVLCLPAAAGLAATVIGSSIQQAVLTAAVTGSSAQEAGLTATVIGGDAREAESAAAATNSGVQEADMPGTGTLRGASPLWDKRQLNDISGEPVIVSAGSAGMIAALNRISSGSAGIVAALNNISSEPDSRSARHCQRGSVLFKWQEGSSMGSVPYFRDDAGRNTQMAEGCLYGYWNNRLCRYDLETLEETVLYEAASSQNGDFCIWGEYIYFMVVPNVTSLGRTQGYLYRVLCDGSEEAVCLTDIVMPDYYYNNNYILDTYDDILYLVGQQDDKENQYFRLGRDGGISPVPEEETLYGKMPAGYSSWRSAGQIITLPYAMRNYGYFFCQNDRWKTSMRMNPDSLEKEMIHIPDEYYRLTFITDNAIFLTGFPGDCYRISLDDLTHMEKIEDVPGYMVAFWNEEGICSVKSYKDWAVLSFVDQDGEVNTQEDSFERNWDSEVNFFDGSCYYYVVTVDGTKEVRRRGPEDGDEPERVSVYRKRPDGGLAAGETCLYSWKDEDESINIDYTVYKIYFTEERDAFGKVNDFLDQLYAEEMAFIEEQKEYFLAQEREAEYDPKDGHRYAYRWDTAGVNYMDEDYVSIYMEWEENGSRYGAHGMDGRMYYVFDRHTGEQIHIMDRVDHSPGEICGIIAPYVEAVATRGTGEEGWEAVILEDGRFYLSEEGIGIHFDPYEINCYAAGNQEVIVPYSAFGMTVDK